MPDTDARPTQEVAATNGHKQLSAREIRDKIAAAVDRKSRIVRIPEPWGVDIEIRSLLVGERAELIESYMTEDGSVDFKAMYPLLLMATCYAPGTDDKVFGEEADVQMLLGKNSEEVEMLAKVAQELSGMREESKTALGKG